MIFLSYLSMRYIRIDVCHRVWRALRNFASDMANVENVEEMVGAREAEAVAVATVSGGAVATESGGGRQPATRRSRRLVTRRRQPVG